jgi:hypothetical protein
MLSQNDIAYLETLQRETDQYRARLAEFDRVASQATDDYVKAILRDARGRIETEIQQRVRSWRSYATFSAPGLPKLSDAEYQARIGLLKV